MSRSEADSEHDGSEHGEERDQEEATYQQPTSWEDFWKRTTEEHAEAMRAAGKDPEKPWEPGENKHGQKIVRGVPLDGTLHCFGCSAVTCAQCPVPPSWDDCLSALILPSRRRIVFSASIPMSARCPCLRRCRVILTRHRRVGAYLRMW